MRRIVGLFCFVLISVPIVDAQTKQDEEALRGLPRAFAAAFAKHDAHELAQIMSDDVDFVTVGLNWLQGREVFENYHERLLKGRFSEILTRFSTRMFVCSGRISLSFVTVGR